MPAGSPFVVRNMLDFCTRHRIEPIGEYFSMRRVNEALAHLASGKMRYLIVLENDLV
jgi:uncharacterized zinc-type alcohol dehydrogenase-like protein